MKNDTFEKADSIISRNIVVEGVIRSAENLTIDGTLKGKLNVDGNVFIGETGIVEADIEAKSVVVKGRVTGDVTALNELQVHPGGELFGTIRARLIHIKEGAVFEGRSQMIRSPAVETELSKKISSVPAKDSVPAGKPGVANG